MSEENKSIHEFDVELICEYFSSVERQGPGSPEVTKKALSFIEGLSDQSKIIDLGCGTGGQTMTLAKNTQGHITGIDLFPKFIEIFNTNAEKLNLQDRVKGVVGSMDNLSYQHDELDLIWSEGSIYNIGFERGINEWRKFLKTGGYIAVSEATWFTDERPDEINNFWNQAYPEIDTVPKKIKQLQDAGYIPIAAFIIPNNCWTKHFFEPQVPVQEMFLKKHKGNKAVEELVINMRREAELYKKYNQYYGYAFYIGKKI